MKRKALKLIVSLTLISASIISLHLNIFASVIATFDKANEFAICKNENSINEILTKETKKLKAITLDGKTYKQTKSSTIKSVSENNTDIYIRCTEQDKAAEELSVKANFSINEMPYFINLHGFYIKNSDRSHAIIPILSLCMYDESDIINSEERTADKTNLLNGFALDAQELYSDISLQTATSQRPAPKDCFIYNQIRMYAFVKNSKNTIWSESTTLSGYKNVAQFEMLSSMNSLGNALNRNYDNLFIETKVITCNNFYLKEYQMKFGKSDNIDIFSLLYPADGTDMTYSYATSVNSDGTYSMTQTYSETGNAKSQTFEYKIDSDGSPLVSVTPFSNKRNCSWLAVFTATVGTKQGQMGAIMPMLSRLKVKNIATYTILGDSDSVCADLLVYKNHSKT